MKTMFVIVMSLEICSIKKILENYYNTMDFALFSPQRRKMRTHMKLAIIIVFDSKNLWYAKPTGIYSGIETQQRIDSYWLLNAVCTYLFMQWYSPGS